MELPLLKIGCCGFPLKKLEYAEQFPVAEVQQTFYQPPRIKTLERWRKLVPEGFEYTLKAWQIITHRSHSPTYRRVTAKLTALEREQCGAFQDTPIVEQAWQITQACAEALSARLLLFQCPASFTPSPENLANLRRFFKSADRRQLKFLWEPRGDWPPEQIHSLCRELNLIHVVDPFLASTTTPEFLYFRLHGGKGFKHIYTDEELEYLARKIPSNTPAYIMFNNLNMLADAMRFKAMMKASN